MKQISWGTMCTKGAHRLKPLLPLEVLVEGEPTYILCNKEDVIVIADHHIRVQNMLKALDKKARAGMPKDVKVTAEMMV